MSTHTHIYHDQLVGAIDGVNRTFSFLSSFQAGTLEVLVNGLEQRKDYDYVENSSPPGITLTVAPLLGDTIWVHYISAEEIVSIPSGYVAHPRSYILYGSIRSIIDLLPESVLCQKTDSQGRLLYVGWMPWYRPAAPPVESSGASVGPVGSVPEVSVESSGGVSSPGIPAGTPVGTPVSISTGERLEIYAYPGVGIYYTETTLTEDINGVPLKPAYELCECYEFLWPIHPSVYKESARSKELTTGSADKYRSYLQAIDCVMTEFRYLLESCLDWSDPYVCPYPILPFLADIVGVKFNYDIPEEFSRREIAAGISLYKRKGSMSNLADMITTLTGFRVCIREHWKDVFRTNVWGDSYPDNVAPGNLLYPKTNTWVGATDQIESCSAEAYGIHGGTCLEKKKISLYLQVSDEVDLWLWFNSSFRDVLVAKLEWNMERFLLFGVEANLFWILYYAEEYLLSSEVTEEDVVGTITFPDDDDKVLDILFYTNDNPSYTNCIEHGTTFRATWSEFAHMAVVDVPFDDIVKYYHPGDTVPYQTVTFPHEDNGWSNYYSQLLGDY